MSLLQSEMTRYHEGMRPRFSNPTFASSNVGSSLGMHMPYAREDNLNPKRKSMSYLSHSGSQSLRRLAPFVSDKEIYEKQQKRYNIINVQPKEYLDTIKVFPKYRLENIDSNYYRKLNLENQISSRYTEPFINPLSNPELPSSPKPMRGKYLNNVDELKDVM